jgi:two-component system response regulator
MMEESGVRKIRVLVAEDNPGDVQLLRMALLAAKLECELVVVEDGREALDFIHQKGRFADIAVPDLAVLDLNLPKNDGLEVLEAMRANPTFAKTPVAVLSSSSAPTEKARLARFGVGRFIEKSPDLAQYMQIGFTIKQFLIESGCPGVSSEA